MTPRRELQIVRLALDYLARWSNEALDLFRSYDTAENACTIDVYGREFFLPTGQEMRVVTGPGRRGNWRTGEIVMIALAFLEWRLDDACDDEYPYDGPNDAKSDTHITFNGRHLLRPTLEELHAANPTVAASRLPAVNVVRQVAWDVEIPTLDEDDGPSHDTVYFGLDCDRAYVLASLVNHDGYDPAIVITPRILKSSGEP